jgi:Cation transporting ATPase, C-terminus
MSSSAAGLSSAEAAAPGCRSCLRSSRSRWRCCASVGAASNPWLLGGIAFELVFAAALVWLPPLQHVFGTAPIGWDVLAFVAPFPAIVWGVDELRRSFHRRAAGKPSARARRYTDDPVGTGS